MSTLLERLRVAVTTYKGDFATLQLLTECGAELERLESERRKLRDIVRHSYLYMVGRLPESEHKQLGRDLAMYGAQNGPVNTPPKP